MFCYSLRSPQQALCLIIRQAAVYRKYLLGLSLVLQCLWNEWPILWNSPLLEGSNMIRMTQVKCIVNLGLLLQVICLTAVASNLPNGKVVVMSRLI